MRSRLTIDDHLNAFCTDTDAYLEGAAGGPLSGLTFAAKDIFDIAGHVNNTRYWAPLEEEFLSGSEPEAFDAEVEHREPAQPGEAVLIGGLVPVAAGNFLYIGASDLVPEVPLDGLQAGGYVLRRSTRDHTAGHVDEIET